MSSNESTLDFVGLDWSAGHPDVFYDRPFDRADVVTDLINSGSNAIKIDVHYFLNQETSQIYSIDGVTETNETMLNTGKYFAEQGFKVVFNLYICLEDRRGDFVQPGLHIAKVSDGFVENAEINTANFFKSYTELLSDLAPVAEQMGANVFVIGSEFGSLTSSNRKEWEIAIDTVRQEYGGLISYGANLNPNKFDTEVTFDGVRSSDNSYDFSTELITLSFGDLLDLLGVQHYSARPRVENGGNYHDDVVTYDLALRGWDDIDLQGYSNIKILRDAADFYGKKILFTEGAFLPMSPYKQMGGRYEPTVDGGDYISYSNLYDAQFFQIYTHLKDVFAGVIHASSIPRQQYVDQPYMAEGKKSLSVLEGTPTENVVKGWATGSSLQQNLTINVSKNSPTAFGYEGQDTFNVSTISGNISGGGNIDTLVVPHLKEKVVVTSGANIFTSIIVDSKLKLEVTDLDLPDLKLSLDSVERIEFKDKKVAYDLDGNAGKAVKLLGVLLGKEASTNKEYLRDVIKLLDDGNSYEQVMNLALDFVLGTNASGSEVVDLLYQNIVGAETPKTYLDEYGALIDNGSMSAAELAIAAGDHSLTSSALDLIGLAQTGVEYAF